ncbi:MAG: EAL domain-containing protein [Symbiopectobacterium sp.]|uniref:EAL domain-containing protein n=1 Tax=Symbiopectobacterium sp. TaxID=2952789 RepID=UPI0039EAEA19
MKITLDVDYESEYLFWPIYSRDERLLALEMTGCFNSGDGKLSVPGDILMSMLSTAQKLALLDEQIDIIQGKAEWLKLHYFLLVWRIEKHCAEILIAPIPRRNAIRALPFVHLEINEAFPCLAEGKGNNDITELSNMFPLWLDNFGSGKVNLKAFHDGLLSYVKIDPKLVWDILSRPAPDLIMDPLLNVMKSHQRGLGVIAKGIDTPDHLQKVHQLNVDAVQGKLWPAIPLHALER